MAEASPMVEASLAPREQPIGVFDSGLGGLTVVRALAERLPSERIIYLGDTARVPYGTRSSVTVRRYAKGCAALLCRRGIKALIIACNTASAVAARELADELSLPVMGVIEPGAEAAVQASRALGGATIGVLATLSTVASGAYPRAVAALAPELLVLQEPAPLLVPLVEEGWLVGQVPKLAIERYLTPLVKSGARVLVLGCTHYPLLHSLIQQTAQELAGEPVCVVDSADVTARKLAGMLEAKQLLHAAAENRDPELLVTDLPDNFAKGAARFLGREVQPPELVDIVPN